jgi:predicted aminopeptidase
MRIRKFVLGAWPRGLEILVSSLALTGCQTAAYYAQAVHGHCQVVVRQEAIADLLKQPQTPEPLKQKLQLALALREFAGKELNLPVNGHYLRYADLGRRYAVWNVTAAPEFSMEAKTWWYPFVGRLAYRGYFDKASALRCAAKLEELGYDVDVGGVEAYSTLGWFRDPLLNTFINNPETELAELLFHELGHQRLFVSGDTDFSEGFAEAVAEEGTRRWLRSKRDPATQLEYEARLRRKAEFTRLVTTAHDQLAAIYPAAGAGAEAVVELKRLSGAQASALRVRKRAILEQLRRDYEAIAGTADHDWGRWFERPLNNAHLNDVNTYYRLLPAFHRLLREHGDDLEAFYREARTLAKLPKAERHERLRNLFEMGCSPNCGENVTY